MKTERIVLFDGVCNLCNGTVRFIIKRDKKKRFLFATLQSGAGQALLTRYGLPAADQSTVVYLKNGIPYVKSRAVLEILKDLGNGWKLFYILIVIPPVIRDFVYGVVAKYRYRVFGSRKCEI